MRIIVCLAFASLLPALSSSAQKTGDAPAPQSGAVSSAEMQRIFNEDQAARQAPTISRSAGGTIYQQDKDRRQRVRKLLDDGALRTAVDFENAAFIFQHSDTAEDYLLAHTLASVAVAKGRSSAVWIMTATLDRYLSKIGRSQIYGTQFHPSDSAGWTQEPYNRTLISDSLRQQLRVPALAEQQRELENYRKEPPQPLH